MSVKIMSMIFDAHGLTTNQKFVLLSLADHGNDEGISIYPSIRKTSDRTGLNPRTIIRIQSELEELGLLSIDRGGGRKANQYKINISGIIELGQDGQRLGFTPPLTQCHPWGVTVSPHP
jgi:DNA-binding PadR family transcriptional regulator